MVISRAVLPAAGPHPAPLPAPAKASVPALSIVVVNYRQWEETTALIRQLLATASLRSGRAEIVVVDNHSPSHPASRQIAAMARSFCRRQLFSDSSGAA